MIGFIDDYRGAYGVEPICRVLKIAPSTYHAHDARRRRPDTAPPRVQRDAALRVRRKNCSPEKARSPRAASTSAHRPAALRSRRVR